MTFDLVLIGLAIAFDPIPLTIFMIVIGMVLVAAAIRQWRRMRPKKPEKPAKWQEHVDHMSLWFAMGLAPVVQPWALIGAGAATVVAARLSNWASDLTLAAFCVLSSASYLGCWLIGKSIYLIVS